MSLYTNDRRKRRKKIFSDIEINALIRKRQRNIEIALDRDSEINYYFGFKESELTAALKKARFLSHNFKTAILEIQQAPREDNQQTLTEEAQTV